MQFAVIVFRKIKNLLTFFNEEQSRIYLLPLMRNIPEERSFHSFCLTIFFNDVICFEYGSKFCCCLSLFLGFRRKCSQLFLHTFPQLLCPDFLRIEIDALLFHFSHTNCKILLYYHNYVLIYPHRVCSNFKQCLCVLISLLSYIIIIS